MKKLFVIASIAILAFSCQKVETVDSDNTTTFALSFISDKPSFEDETKTTWTGSHVVWEEGNQMRAGYYDVTAGAWGKKAPSFKINAGEAADGIFRPESDIISLSENHQYKFYSVYPNFSLVKESVWDESETQSVLIPSEQALSSVSFDPKADVMVGRSTSSYTAVSFDKTANNETTTVEGIQRSSQVSLEWKRLVALSEITFKGLTLVSPTEKIQSVTMKTQDGTALTGTVSVDFTNGEYTPSATTNEVVCKGITSISGNLTVWFSTLPFVANELTFEIATNAHTYTRKIENLNLDFKRNYRNTLGVSMAPEKVTIGDAEGADLEWVKMDLSMISPDAEIIYVAHVGDAYYALANDKGTSAAPTAVSVTVEDGKVTSAVEDNIVWNVSVDTDNNIKFTPKGDDANWLYCTASNNGVRVGTNANSSFVVDQSGYLKNVSTSRFVGVYDNQDWRCYTSSTTNISVQTFGFYVNTSTNVTKELIGIEVSGTPSVFWKGDDFNTTGITVTATWDDESETDVTSSCVFTGYDKTTAGYQIVTVSYRGETTSYNVIVKTIANTKETAYTASQAVALIDAEKDLNTEVYVKGIVSEIVTAFSEQYGNISFDINDGTNDFRFFRNFKGANNQKWVSEAEAPAVGDEVVGLGKLVRYDQNDQTVYEFAAGNYIVEIEKTSTGGGDDPILYSVVCASDLDGGSISANPTSAVEGTTITLTATPTSGNELDSWTVTRADNDEAVQVTNATFTMPAADVNVSATFKPKQGGSWHEAAMAAGTNGSSAKVNDKDAIKVGTSKLGGDMTITVAAGATKLKFYAAAWNGVNGLSLNITPNAKVKVTTVDLTADAGISNNSPFTLSGEESSFVFEIDLINITEETTLTLTSSSAKRFVVWGAEYCK